MFGDRSIAIQQLLSRVARSSCSRNIWVMTTIFERLGIIRALPRLPRPYCMSISYSCDRFTASPCVSSTAYSRLGHDACQWCTCKRHLVVFHEPFLARPRHSLSATYYTQMDLWASANRARQAEERALEAEQRATEVEVGGVVLEKVMFPVATNLTSFTHCIGRKGWWMVGKKNTEEGVCRKNSSSHMWCLKIEREIDERPLSAMSCRI